MFSFLSYLCSAKSALEEEKRSPRIQTAGRAGPNGKRLFQTEPNLKRLFQTEPSSRLKQIQTGPCVSFHCYIKPESITSALQQQVQEVVDFF